MKSVEIVVDWRRGARRALVACVLIELSLFVLDYHLNWGRLIDVGAVERFFSTAREDSLASWFGTTQTLLAGLTFALNFALAKRVTTKWRSWGWLILALFFCYMAVDDGAQVHERVATTWEALRPEDEQATSPSYTWQVLLLPFFAAMGCFLLWFLFGQMPGRWSRVALISALASLVIAVGLDFVEGLEWDHPLNLATHAVERWPAFGEWSEARFEENGYTTYQHFARSLEETLEMFANSLFWFLGLSHLAVVGADFHVRGSEGASRGASESGVAGARSAE